MTSSSPYPCLSGQDWSTYCQPLHQQLITAETAKQLMRSRYSGFCLGKVDYLLVTLHLSQLSPEERKALRKKALHKRNGRI